MAPSCAVSGTWSLWLRSQDRAGSISSQKVGDAVTVRAGDHLRPEVARVADQGGQPTFRVSEDVVGVSTRSA